MPRARTARAQSRRRRSSSSWALAAARSSASLTSAYDPIEQDSGTLRLAGERPQVRCLSGRVIVVSHQTDAVDDHLDFARHEGHVGGAGPVGIDGRHGAEAKILARAV